MKSTNYNYIVNCAVYNNINNPNTVDEEVSKILTTCSSIATENRKVSIVIGLNVPEDATATEEQMQHAAERAKELSKNFGNTNLDVHVIHYRWNRFDERLQDRPFKANERINYVAIRNNLFYSEENQAVVRQVIEEAKTHDNASVKFLALDGDSDLPLEELEKLETLWNQDTHMEGNDVHLSPLITSGFYQFRFKEEDEQLVKSDGTLNWGFYLATIENRIDLESKQLISKENLVVPLKYKKFELPQEDDSISNESMLNHVSTLQTNLILLDRVNLGTLDVNAQKKQLLIHYCDFLALIPAFKEACKENGAEGEISRLLLREQLTKSLREIEKIEQAFDAQKISFNFELSGEQILYPSENVMFVSLYDKIGERQFNLFEEISVSQQEGAKKVHRLWGDDVGREEGENIAAQMRKFWQNTRLKELTTTPSGSVSPRTEKEVTMQKTKLKAQLMLSSEQERSLVEYPHVFGTALPPRAYQFLTDQQKDLAALLPTSKDELKAVVDDPKRFNQLIDTCADLISTRSQTSLGKKFLRQRKRFIAGQQNPEHVLKDPKKKLSSFTRFLREGASKAFESYFQDFHQERLDVLKTQLRIRIKEAAEQG